MKKRVGDGKLIITRGKVLSWEYRSPRKRNSRPHVSVIRNSLLSELSWKCITYLLCVGFVYIGNGFVYVGKNPRFTAFLDSNLDTRLAIVTENELGLAFPPPKKFRPDPSTFFSYRGNKQTNNVRRWFHNPSRKLSRGSQVCDDAYDVMLGLHHNAEL